MKRSSESAFGDALRDVDDDDLPLYVYKPPDDGRNWKPCDFMAWGTRGEARRLWPVWFEVKDTAAVATFPFKELRPSQVAGIHDAHRIGIPYYLAVYWRRTRTWTISDAHRVLQWRDEPHQSSGWSWLPTSIPRELLASRFGIDSTPGQLASTLRMVLLGEVD